MRDELTLEKEFEVREDACKQVFELVEGLNKTIDFYCEKGWFVATHQLFDPSCYEPLRYMVMMEMGNLAVQFGKMTKMTKECLLPVDTRDPLKMIAPHTLRVDNFKPHDLGGKCLRVEAQVREAYEKMFMAMGEYKDLFFFYGGERVAERFEQLMQRYVKENKAMLDDYAEDIDDAKEARAELKRDYKGKVAVEVWIKSGSDVEKTIRELAERGCVEKDLLPLLEYRAKHDRLKNMKKRTRKSIRKATVAAKGDNNGIMAERVNVNVNLSPENEERLVDGLLNKKQIGNGNRD